MRGGLLLLSTLVLSSSITVHADSIPLNDPRIIISRGQDSERITTLHFAVAVNAAGGGIENFDNASGKEWVGLIVTVQFPNVNAAMAAGVSCSNGDVLSNIFSSCSSVLHGKILTITLTHGLISFCTSSRCPDNTEFFVDLNDPNVSGDNGKGGWTGAIIEAEAIPETVVPEPETFLLEFSGLGAVWGFWSLRKRFNHSQIGN